MIQQITKPFKYFFKLEAASGIVLLIAAILALIIKANMAANNKTNPEAASSLKKYRNGFVMCWIICIIYLYRDHLSIAKKVYLTYKTDDRGVAQPGSASGLGPEGRRFKSCRPDQYYEKSKNLHTY